jgi:predicted patatin/cPLA2 family phospholipase
MLRKYPAVARAIEARPVMYNRQMVDIDQREKAGTALVIRPEESLGIGHTENNPAELQRVYDLGREVALKRLDEVKAYLNA